jgi:hypothetical protein
MLFVLMTLAGTICAWVAYQLNWIRQRHEFMETHSAIFYDEPANAAPWQLALFGEKSREMMAVGDIDRARQLFPETKIVSWNWAIARDKAVRRKSKVSVGSP